MRCGRLLVIRQCGTAQVNEVNGRNGSKGIFGCTLASWPTCLGSVEGNNQICADTRAYNNMPYKTLVSLVGAAAQIQDQIEGGEEFQTNLSCDDLA